MSKEEAKNYKTIVISDLHLGSKWSKAKEATDFLKKNSCETLILCGDIIDGWALMRSKKNKWKRRHTNFFKAILDIQHTTKIIYIRGNHDDFMDSVLPLKFANIELVRSYIHTSGDKKYYVIHGDIFDKITSRYSWLAKLGDIGYSILLRINDSYNKRRLKNKLPYRPIGKKIKNIIKASVSYISDFETHLSVVAKKRKCDGVICGHIHHPEIKTFPQNNILYLNAGDWVESLSALVEDFEGKWSIYRYEQRLKSEI